MSTFLGELEFKAEDFIGYPIEGKQMLADLVNRLLTERLEKAQIVYSKLSDTRFWGVVDNTNQTDPRECDLSARLVCVEEIKK